MRVWGLWKRNWEGENALAGAGYFRLGFTGCATPPSCSLTRDSGATVALIHIMAPRVAAALPRLLCPTPRAGLGAPRPPGVGLAWEEPRFGLANPLLPQGREGG